jgi:branched-subunit amino acid ABC-type transport system permease component
MGFNALLMGAAAAIIGGFGSVTGAWAGGLLVGIVQHLGVISLPTEWQDAIVFVLVITFLIFRPQGFFGRSIRTAEI